MYTYTYILLFIKIISSIIQTQIKNSQSASINLVTLGPINVRRSFSLPRFIILLTYEICCLFTISGKMVGYRA